MDNEKEVVQPQDESANKLTEGTVTEQTSDVPAESAGEGAE